MKHLAIVLISVFCSWSATAQVRFGKYFHDNTLRILYTISGDSAHCHAVFNDWNVFDGWSGARHNLNVSPLQSDMDIIMNDNATGRTIYHNSYSTLFCEWQLMQDNNPSGDFKESVRLPMPKRPATIYLIRNYHSGQKDTALRLDVNPKQLPHPANISPKYQVVTLHAAKTRRSIGLVFLPEGYKADEMDKFLETAKMMTKGLFEYEPFAHHYKSINIQAVLAPSPDSGIDIPNKNIKRNTLMDFSYGTFGIDRYIGTRNHWAISDIASNTDWNHAIILVNNKQRGGGGIYNFYSVFPEGAPRLLELFLHEFGHAIADLLDEYADPDNPAGQKEDSNRDCIMKDLHTHFYCNECKEIIEKVIRRNIGQ